jgi:glycosyltransferase involved in cell wall biosynthesis
MAEYGITAVNVLPACRALDLPLVVHFHGIDAYHRLVLRAYLEGYRRVFRYASAVLTASAAMREHLVRLGADPARTHALPCAVDCSLFSPRPQASRAPVFLAVGRFVAKKAPQRTLEAFARVSRECPDARLRMVGYGPLSGHCRTAVRRLGIQEKVAFPGRRDHEAVCEELQGALGFVQHSVVARSGDSEGTPVSILEAAAAGLPVVATRHGGIPECVLDGHSGLLVEEGDVEGMAHAMIRLIREPGLAEAMGRRGREHVRTHYSMDEYATRLQSIFMESLGGPAGGQAGRSYSAYAVPSATSRR